ncbi:uncharacterized protein [Branchiostoma lanceolatum]|uniref:uncharacterized protein isoform X1 n=1 Tax=Branchiostoma lanceolatum TaxID=7740 RepID=UPI00345353F4
MKFVLACLAVLSLEALSAQASLQRRPYLRVNASPPKPGVCPPVPPRAVGICADTCYGDEHCGGDQKCCRNSCGAFTCAPPDDVTTQSPRTTPTNVLPTDSQPGNESTEPSAAEGPLGRGSFPDGILDDEDVPAAVTELPTTTAEAATTTAEATTTTAEATTTTAKATTTTVATTHQPLTTTTEATTSVAAPEERPLPPREQRCSLQPDVGPCRGFYRRFYYSIQAGACKPFGYGGCLGNTNNFRTVEDCENTCRSTKEDVCPPCQEFDSLKPLYCSKQFIMIGEVQGLSTSGDATTATLQVKRLNVYRQGSLRLRGRSYFPQRFRAQVVLPNQDDDCACASLTVGQEYIFMGDSVNSNRAGVIGDGDYVRAVNSENARELANLYRMGRSVVCRV